MKIRTRLSMISSALYLLSASCIGCSIKPSEAAGIYVTDNGSIEVKQDGTFRLTTRGGQTTTGQWKLTSHLLDTGLELDSATSADEYRLTQRHGALCLEVRRDFVYWCKAE